MDDEITARQSSLVSAAMPLLKGIAGLGTAVASLTALGVVLGDQYFKAYLKELRTPWLMSELSTATLLRAGAHIVVPAIFAALMGALWIVNSTAAMGPYRAMKWVTVSLDVAAVLLLSLASFHFAWLSPDGARFGHAMIQLLFGASVGLTVVAILGRVARGEAEQSRSHMWIAYLVTTSLFAYIPSTVGRLDAQDDADPATTDLPQALLKDDTTRAWRLIALEGGEALLYSPAEGTLSIAARLADAHNVTLEVRRTAEAAKPLQSTTPAQ